MRLFLDDINRLSTRKGSWVIPILGATGLRDRKTQLHFCYNTNKHDDSYNDPKARIVDYATFDKMYKEMETKMAEKFNLYLDKNEWYAINPKTNMAQFINAENVFTLRIECFVYVFNNTFFNFIKTLAEVFNYAFEPEVQKQLPLEMLERQKGKDFGMSDYVN